MSSHYVLKIQYVNKPPETRNIGARVTTIGREAGDIVLGDPQSSGRHAEIHFENGNVRVKDLGSTNGTFFNGQRSPEFAMQAGQGFSIGQTVMTLMAVQGAARAGAGKTMIAMGGAPPRPPGAPPSPGGFGAPPGAPPGGGFGAPPGAPPGPPGGGFGGPPPGAPPGPPGGGFGGPPPGAPPGPPGGGFGGPPPGAPPGGFGGPPPSSPPMDAGPPPGGGFPPQGGPPPGGGYGPPQGGPPPGGPPGGFGGPPQGGPPPGGFGGPPPGGPPGGGYGGPPQGGPPGGGYGGPPQGGPPQGGPPGALYSGPSSPPPLPPAVGENVDWMPGEQVHACITADGFFVGANPIAKMIAAFNALITKLTFGHNRVHVVVTNQRVMMVQSVQMMCGFSKSKGINAIPVGSLIEAGWAKQTVYCCIHTRAVTLKSKTQTYNLVVKKINDQQMREFMTNASGTITANALAGTAT